MVLGQEVSSLTWKVGALGIASGCSGLQLGAEGFLFNLRPSCGVENSFKFSMCLIVYSHWNGCGFQFHHGHLGGCSRSNYSRGRDWIHGCSWSWGGK